MDHRPDAPRISKNLKLTGWLLFIEGVLVTVLWNGNQLFDWF
jgi:hypothetical protein